MRKNKGYQLDIHKTWRGKEAKLSWAGGENKTVEQLLDDANKKFDERIKNCKKEYEKISKKTTLTGKDLYDYCRYWMLWEVKFDNELNLIPMKEAIATLEEYKRRWLASKLYDIHGGYQKRIINKDNQKFVYNSSSSSGSGLYSLVRIPSMKRSVATWKRFYELFPYYKEHYNDLTQGGHRIKLKRVW